MTDARRRPERDEYFMGIALAVRERANCLGYKVGAILVVEDRIVSTGYNGTPARMQNCDVGGCERCANRDRYGRSIGYDVCICVHAEQNALLAAARFGIPVKGAVLYCTLRPCFGCSKELLQAEVKAVRYLTEWTHPEAQLQKEYDKLQAAFSHHVTQVVIDDPGHDWAVTATATVPQDSGHTVPGEGAAAKVVLPQEESSN